MSARRTESIHPLLQTLRKEMQRRGDATRAKAQQAYMKSAMPYYGLPNAEMRAVCKEIFSTTELADASDWQAAVLALWRGAQFREERYAAMQLTGVRAARRWQTLNTLPMYEEMIVSGAWWDYVDELAAHRVGALVRAFPKEMKQELLDWSRCDDMWKRRTAILSQLRFKKDTDLELLYACIEPSIESKEFFLRKAIGWALRQYAWFDPKPIIKYVKANANRLSGLSKREALKNVLKDGLISEIP